MTDRRRGSAGPAATSPPRWKRDGILAAIGSRALRAYDRFASVAGHDVFDFLATPVYEDDWDLLVVLDACRVDLMREVAPEYDFVAPVETWWSVSGESRGWIDATFGDDAVREWAAATGYVSGNPYSEWRMSDSDVGYLDRVIADAFDHDRGLMPPRPITDRAIWAARRREELGIDRLVVHYMQPHFPAVDHPELGSQMHPHDDSREWVSVWERLADRDSDLHLADVWPAYRDNLRHVLDDVSVLLSNVDADRVVITADHGNAVGEWGFYGHGTDPVPVIRRVPRCVTSAKNRDGREPDHRPPDPTDVAPDDEAADLAPDDEVTDVDPDDEATAEKLRSLGYRE